MLIILLLLAMALTVFALFAGLITMAVGGDWNRRYGNRLMRLRVCAQGVALALLALVFLFSRS